MTLRKIYWVLVPFLILAISCDSQQNFKITDNVWMLQSIEYENGDVTTIDDPSSYTIIFNDSLRIEGQADCNACFGEYEISNDTISIRFGCTYKGCGVESKGWEYTLAIKKASSYEIVVKELHIFFDNDKNTLYFKKD